MFWSRVYSLFHILMTWNFQCSKIQTIDSFESMNYDRRQTSQRFFDEIKSSTSYEYEMDFSITYYTLYISYHRSLSAR